MERAVLPRRRRDRAHRPQRVLQAALLRGREHAARGRLVVGIEERLRRERVVGAGPRRQRGLELAAVGEARRLRDEAAAEALLRHRAARARVPDPVVPRLIVAPRPRHRPRERTIPGEALHLRPEAFALVRLHGNRDAEPRRDGRRLPHRRLDGRSAARRLPLRRVVLLRRPRRALQLPVRALPRRAVVLRLGVWSHAHHRIHGAARSRRAPPGPPASAIVRVQAKARVQGGA
mmetsp:Transcript_42448/g.133093  ORF Transcript_42448/g.133093 Transcript_42448/m.133093 type:complete len:233 (-) Transcript_42448:31-729(-)